MPDGQYNEMRIDFLKNYTDGALDALHKHKGVVRQSTNTRQAAAGSTSTTSTIKNFFGGKNKNNNAK